MSNIIAINGGLFVGYLNNLHFGQSLDILDNNIKDILLLVGFN